ncbi:unnamed protein product, partial [Ixodes pacificus]
MPGTPGICSITESSLLLLPGPVVIAVVDAVNPETRLPPPASGVRGTSRDVNGSEDRRRGDSVAEGPRPPHPSGAVLSRKVRSPAGIKSRIFNARQLAPLASLH